MSKEFIMSKATYYNNEFNTKIKEEYAEEMPDAEYLIFLKDMIEVTESILNARSGMSLKEKIIVLKNKFRFFLYLKDVEHTVNLVDLLD